METEMMMMDEIQDVLQVGWRFLKAVYELTVNWYYIKWLYIEIGWTWSGGSTSGKDTCTEICGDSKRFNSLSTYWDDGNIISGDGWSLTCWKEIGWACSGGSTNSKDICTEICGDGKKFNSLGTYWDDGNLILGDGWGSTWGIESGWSCTGGTSTAKDTWTENCGDGIKFNSVSTYCDDGNVNNGDGCSSTWYKEIGWIWSGGSLTAKDTCIEVCGDGMKFNSLSTYCDDGNSFNGDGCSLSWDVESGWKWTGGNASTKDIWSDLWGDGIRFNSYSTYWDDGNKINGDGWSSVWSVETGFTWTGGSTSSADTWTEACGDGKRFTTVGSYWDDGNNSNGDGWNSVWGIESGWTCSGGTSTTKDICTEICGDGKKYNSISTYCDDGNKINGDGWSSTWSVETYWSWSGGSSTHKDSWIEHWGDGKRFNSISIYCDDGNIINNDGWSSTCSVESGWTCSGGSSITKDIWVEVWGDGKKFNTISTYWDDGNTLNGDGCNSSWSIETGWTCSGGTSTLPDTCVDICGDGKKYGSLSTKWDDGNKVNGDGWSMSCNVEVGWTCSGGTPTSADTCTEIWGDGIRFNSISTYCDDGNLANGDGWSSTCVKETGWVWGGGSSTSKDIWNDIWGDGKKYSSAINFWDDGNTSSNDGCSYACSVETGWICSGGTPSNPDTWTEIWNDGIRFNSVSTYWDDGNAINKDGWDSSCNVETGYYWTGGTPSTKDSCFEIWGDGIRFNSINMYWDDGNIISGDGWNNIWGIESGWFWFGGSTTRSDIWTEIWGDGIRINSYNNYWDDGNHINGDGWSMACGVELGWKCDGGGLTSKDSWSEICGDGIRFNTNTTYCDDGDLAEGDGWNLSWVIENGWGWSGGNSTKEDICSEICGDGIRFNNRSSYWDDGNVVDGDGWSSKCKVEPQFKCSGGNSTTIDVWRPLLIVSTQEATACSTTQTAAGVGATLSAGTSIMTMSSPVGIFSMINQFQMLLLIIISGVYLSDGVKATITGMGYSMLNFDFLQFERIDMFGKFINFITFDQTNESLTEIGITSGNSFVNVFKLMLLTITIIMIHILLIPVISKWRNCKKESKYNKFGNKLYYFLTFALYVRLILQSYLIIALSAISEIAVFDVSNSIKITSFIISWIFLLGIITFSLICWYQIWKAHPDITLSNQIYFIEFFNGLKNTTYSRLFPAIYMLQRILCAAFLFSFSKLDPRIKMCFLAFINLISLLYLLIVRPYTNFKNLLLECLSQTLVSIFSWMLIYFATESKWNDIVTWIFIGLIMVSTLISMIISIIDLILNIRKLIQKWYKPSKVSNDQENTKVEITQNNSYISKMQSISNRMHQTREEYKIDLSESDPTTINIQLDIEHPKPQFPILNRRYIFGR